MNELDTEEAIRVRASRAQQAARKKDTSGKHCAVCEVTNPHLLQRVLIERSNDAFYSAHLCHNHGRMLFFQKKIHFAHLSTNSQRDGESTIIPGILVDEEWLRFQSRQIQDSILYKYPDIPYLNRVELRNRDTVYGVPSLPEFHPYADLKRTVKRQMRISPFTPHEDCACCVCGEARPIMIEVHHVDRARNSERAVFLCLNHHALMTLEQETEQPDEQSMEDIEERAEFAALLGQNGLLRLIAEHRDALSKRVPQRFELAHSFFEVFHAPPEEPKFEPFP